MIHTVTANPALDLTYKVQEIKYDDTTRAHTVLRAAGGKGINVSRVVSRLNHSTIALGFVGGRTGDEIEDLLKADGVRAWFHHHKDPTRTNAIIQDAKGKQIRISGPGTEVNERDINAFLKGIFDLRAPDFLALSGSLLKGMPKDFYLQIMQRAQTENIKVVADADGDELEAAINAGAYLIKPNKYELERFANVNIHSIQDALKASKKALAAGVTLVLCSLGPDGAILVNQEQAWLATPPKVKVDSAVGAGDSLLAGALVALADKQDLAEALRLGVACGTATATTPGTSLCYKETIDELLPRIDLKAL